MAPSPQDTRALFLEFDTDGNNEISYNEFVSALRVSLLSIQRLEHSQFILARDV